MGRTVKTGHLAGVLQGLTIYWLQVRVLPGPHRFIQFPEISIYTITPGQRSFNNR